MGGAGIETAYSSADGSASWSEVGYQFAFELDFCPFILSIAPSESQVPSAAPSESQVPSEEPTSGPS
jgi:hypothetical protein